MAHDPVFTQAILAVLPRARIKLDGEGWPFVAAQYGRIEWRGLERDGTARLYAYTDHVQQIRKLRAVPGSRPAQVGQQEAAFSILADNATALQAIARVLKTRTRRAPETGWSAADLAKIRP